MAHHSRKSIFTLIVLTLCLAFGICVMTACGETNTPTDTAVTYTVTVMIDADNAASGVKVTPKKGSVSFEAKTTDENGKVEFSLVADDYQLTLSNLPAHYEAPASTELVMTADQTEYTFILAKKFAYTVNLVNPDKTPFTVSGVEVGICTLEGNCLAPVAPENGTALIEADKGNYHVKVDLPAGYAYDCDTDGYYTGENFSAESTVMTITIYPVSVVDVAKSAMTDAEKTAFANKDGIYGFDTERPAYGLSQSVAAGGKLYFSFTPEITGQYNFYNGDAFNYYLNGQTFSSDIADENTLPQYTNLEAGKTYHFAAHNTSEEAATVEWVVVAPTSSYIKYNGVGGEIELTVGKANSNAIIEFNPTSAGAYKLTVQGTTPAIVASPVYASETVYPEPADSDYTAGANITVYYSTFDFNATNKKPVYFTVTVKGSYPAAVTVKLEKVQDAKDSFKYVEVKETLTQYADVTDKVLYGVPMDGSAELDYNETSKTYFYDGKEVVVMITENLGSDRFADGAALAYIGKDNTYLTADYTVTTTASEGYGISIVDYTRFLRGFKDYEIEQGKQGPILKIPETLEEENCYANFVNEDGVYPLTAELKEFLEAFYEVNADTFLWQIPEDADLDCGWMFPLYYYNVEDEGGEEGDEDVIVGTYSLGNMMLGITTLTVSANGTYTMQESMGTSHGSWTKNVDGTYTFIDDAWSDLPYIVERNAETGALTFFDGEDVAFKFSVGTDGDADNGDDDTPISIVGTYTSGNMMIGLTTLTVNEDGTFTIRETMGTVSGVWSDNEDGTYTFTDVNEELGNLDYSVIFNADGILVFFDEDNIAYEFEPAND